MYATERLLTLLALLLASACGPSLKDLSRGMARDAEQRASRPPVPERERSYFDRDLERPRTEVEYLVLWDGRSVLHGVERAWYANGRPRHERGFDHGEPRGWWRTWYEDGTLRSENEIVPDAATPMRWWHPNGQLSSEGMARNSLREGAWRGWHPDGSLAYEGDYRGGVRHGPWTFWHPGGERAEAGEYRDGARIGEWQAWPAPEVPGSSATRGEPPEAGQ